MFRKSIIVILPLIVLVSGGVEYREHETDLPSLRQIELGFIGDIMSHTWNLEHPPYQKIYSHIRGLLQSPDLTFGNFEFVIDETRSVSGYPRFNAPGAYAEAAIEAGVDVVSIANNHSADYGESGAIRTMQFMEALRTELGIVYSGITPDPEDLFVPETIDTGEWRIGFLAVTDFTNIWGGSHVVQVASYRYPLNRDRLFDAVERRRDEFDIFILSYHGGEEYVSAPSEERRDFFMELVSAGIDIIWGHHPHVLQPWEIVEVNGAKKLIMYSLGNFVSAQPAWINPAFPEAPRAATGESAVLVVRVLRLESGRLDFSVYPVPIVHFPDENGYISVYSFGGLPERYSEGRPPEADAYDGIERTGPAPAATTVATETATAAARANDASAADTAAADDASVFSAVSGVRRRYLEHRLPIVRRILDVRFPTGFVE